jgi:hypothetical protein
MSPIIDGPKSTVLILFGPPMIDLVLSLISWHAIAPSGCDQGAHEYCEGDAKEDFAAYH